MRRCVVIGIVSALVACAAAAVQYSGAHNWTGDSWHYARMMLQDRGIGSTEATRQATAFIETQPIGQLHEYRVLFEQDPTRTEAAIAAIFAPRQVYPLIASLFYPVLGFNSLIFISTISFVIFITSTYALIATTVDDISGAIGAAFLLALPPVRYLAVSALSDMTATAIWTLAFLALATYLRRPAKLPFIYFTVAVATLTWTRPMVHMLCGGCLALVVSAVIQGDRAALRSRGALLIVCSMAFITYLGAGFVAGSPSVLSGVTWLHKRDLETGSYVPSSAWLWYLRRTAKAFGRLGIDAIIYIAPLLAVYAAFNDREQWVVQALYGVVIASLLTVLINPIAGDMFRTIELPVAPLVLTCAAIVLRRSVSLKIARVFN